MRLSGSILGTLAAVTLPLPPAAAQDVADRLARISDGSVRMSFATRPEVCGNGHFIGEETADGFIMYVIGDGNYSVNRMEDVRPPCSEGPMRLVVDKVGGEVRQVRAAVGVEWIDRSGVTDLGMVPGGEAADWLLGLVPVLTGDAARVAFLAAAMVADARIAGRLVALATDRSVTLSARTGAMRWVSAAARREGMEARADRALRSIVSDRDDRSGARERAVRSLSRTAANDAFLRDAYAGLGDASLQERVIRRLGETRSAENERWIESVALDARGRTALRERALRVLAGDLRRPDLVRGMYDRLDVSALRERALRLVAEHDPDGALPWLRDIALGPAEPLAVRERALRLIGEMAGSTETLRALYPALDHHALRERVLRVVAERDRTEAVPWLRTVMEDGDEGVALRERAIRLLGEMRQRETLRAAYPRLERSALRERVLRVVGERAGSADLDWIESVALDANEAAGIRERAVRVLADGRVESTRLVDLYDRIDSHSVRERLIRIFAGRGDAVSLAKLEAIVREDAGSSLGRSAARRLAERTSRNFGR